MAPDTFSGLQLSIGFLFRLTAAVAMVIAANQYLAAGYGYPGSFLVLAGFYAVKSAISVAFARRNAMAFLLFVPCFAVSLGFFCYSELKKDTLELTDILVWLPFVYLAIPTASFILDILSDKQRSVDYMLIRSLVELSLLVPIWMFLSVIIMLLLGFVGI